MKKIFIALLVLIITINLSTYGQEKEEIIVEHKYPVKSFGKEEDAATFYIPMDLSFNKYDDCLYVSDKGNHRIVVLNKDLKYIRSFGKKGKGPGEFTSVFGVCFDKESNIIAIDNRNFNMQIFSKEGKYLHSTKINLKANIGSGFDPIEIDSKGRIYLSIPLKEKLISVLDKKGKELGSFVEVVENKENVIVEYSVNRTRYVIDDDDNIYCISSNQTFLKKYNEKYNLIKSVELDYLPEIKKAISFNKKLLKSSNKSERMASKLMRGYMDDISVDDKYVYVLLDEKTIYVFDKNSFKIIKKIILDVDSKFVLKFDASAKDFIYAIDFENMLILKFEK